MFNSFTTPDRCVSTWLPRRPARCDLARPCGKAFLVRERHFGSLRAAEIGSFRSCSEMICCCRLKPATQYSLASHYHCLRSTAGCNQMSLTAASISSADSMQFQWSAPAALCSPASGAGSCPTNYSDWGRVQQLPPIRCSPSCAILKAQKRATRRYERLVSLILLRR